MGPIYLHAQPTLSADSSNTPSSVESLGTNSVETSNLMTNPGATAEATNSPALAQPPPAPPAVVSPAVILPAPPSQPTFSEPPPIAFSSLLILGAMVGVSLYYVGLGRAKNSAHTSTLLLLGAMFSFLGYWAGGFALAAGGVGDAHAALAHAGTSPEWAGLDHEIGFLAFGHHWGVMGSSAFFLSSDASPRGRLDALFLGEAVLVIFAVTIALGGAIERGRILSLAVVSFLVGSLIYPLFANWIWGGGWLAELGREFGLGHGVVDLAGAGVIHLSAGTLALVLALVLGPRQGRFGRDQATFPLPGHHVPSTILGALILLIVLTAISASSGGPRVGSSGGDAASAAVNTLLAAAGGLLTSFLLAGYHRKKPEPAFLCRGLLGGAVAVSAAGALVDSWAALLIGLMAGLIVEGVFRFLERRRVDDPTGAFAVHGAAGAWGLLAVGIFANGATGLGLNGVEKPVQGLLQGGNARQMLAQGIGVLVGFAVIFFTGYLGISLINKILGLRVEAADESSGLDWPQVGALGYQVDPENEGPGRSS